MQHTLDNLISVHLYIVCVLNVLTEARNDKGHCHSGRSDVQNKTNQYESGFGEKPPIIPLPAIPLKYKYPFLYNVDFFNLLS